MYCNICVNWILNIFWPKTSQTKQVTTLHRLLIVTRQGGFTQVDSVLSHNRCSKQFLGISRIHTYPRHHFLQFLHMSRGSTLTGCQDKPTFLNPIADLDVYRHNSKSIQADGTVPYKDQFTWYWQLSDLVSASEDIKLCLTQPNTGSQIQSGEVSYSNCWGSHVADGVSSLYQVATLTNLSQFEYLNIYVP